MENKPKKPLIQNRVLLIGEGLIRPEILEKLEDKHIQMFMREPNPMKWPPEMEALLEYLTDEERTRLRISQVLTSHDHLLKNALEKWADQVVEAVHSSLFPGESPDLTIDTMTFHIRTLLVEWHERLPR